MKKPSIYLLINVVFVLAGIIFLIYSQVENFTQWLSRVMGALFILPAVAYMVGGAWRGKAMNSNLYWLGVLPAVGGACFGVLMILEAEMFDGMIEWLMGVLLLALGLYHVFYMLLSRRQLRLRLWHLLMPLMMVAAGAVMLLVDSARNQVVLFSGIGMLLFAFTSVVEHFARVKDMPSIENDSQAATANTELQKTEKTFEKVEHQDDEVVYKTNIIEDE